MRTALWAALLLGLVAIATAADNPAPAIVGGENAPRGRQVQSSCCKAALVTFPLRT